MSYRRSGVNYILWALYGLTVCAALTIQAKEVCMLLGWGEAQWYLPAAAGVILLLFLVLFLPFRLLSGRRGAKRREKRQKKSGFLRRAVEGGYLTLLIAVSFSLRLWSMGGADGSGMRGAQAALTSLSGFPFASLTFSSLYAWLKLLLSGLTESGIRTAGFLPPLYETLGVLLFYPALRRLAGRLPAVTVTAVLAFFPVLPGLSASGGQDGFFLTAASILLLFSSLFITRTDRFLAGTSSAQKRRANGSLAVLAGCAVLCGFFTGAAVFLDLAFFPLLIFPVWASLFVRPGGRPQERAGSLALLLAAALGYAALLAIQIRLSGEGPAEILAARYGLAGGFPGVPAGSGLWAEGFSVGNTALAPGAAAYWTIPLVCLCILYVFGFFDQKGNLGSVWLPSFLISTFLCLFAENGGAEDAAALLFWLVMAGMGLHGAFFREDRKRTDAEGVQEASQAVSAVPAGEAQREETLAAKREPLPGEPIPNPLPVPKRHERKEMDYAYEPGEDEMFFDIDRVEEGDDFDFQ